MRFAKDNRACSAEPGGRCRTDHMPHAVDEGVELQGVGEGEVRGERRRG